MSKTNYPGIDYSAGQTVNRNPETGFRYGVINTNALGEFAWDEITNHGVNQDWADYCDEIKAGIRSALSDAIRGDRLTQAVSDAFDAISDTLGDSYEQSGDCTRYLYEADGYKFQVASDGDIFVLESPFFTYAQFCSPCAPGACYLKSPLDGPVETNKCYCLGADWFDDSNPCPYPIYSIATGEQI